MTNTRFNRADLVKAFGKDNIKLIQAFESLQERAIVASRVSTSNAEGTEALQDATVVTLSPNATLTNERILAVDAASMYLTDNGAGNTVVIGLLFPIQSNGGFALTLNLAADTVLNLPIGGNVPSSIVGPYTSDADAAANGVQIGDIYKGSAGLVTWRQV